MKVFAAALALASAADTEVKVIGGYTPEPHSQPYILSLQRFGSHFCGASLYAGNRAVSACHCTVYASFDAVAGAHNIRQNESSQQKQAGTWVRHPAYDSNTLVNDVAVITFASSFSVNDYVVPYALPEFKASEWMASGTEVRVCGWGNTSMIGTNMPDTLKCVEVPIVDNDTCNARQHYNGGILPGMFCAGLIGEGGKDACQGDSGGPVLLNNEIVGATSWGIGCAYPNYPGVYTDVAMFRDWIDEQS